MTKPLSIIIIAAAASLMFAAPAAAQIQGDRYRSEIAYADLDLASAAGADAMIDRLNSAAREACDARMGRMSIAEHRNIRACSTTFVQKGVVRLSNASVSQRYIERGGRLPAVTVASL
jgi:UrcA family protein